MPKWEERSRVGVYLGHSSQHAQNVSLVLNPKTGFISPQFHCVFDDLFDTSRTDKNVSKLWAEKAGQQETSSNMQEEPSRYREYLQTIIPSKMQVPFDMEPSEGLNDDFSHHPMMDDNDEDQISVPPTIHPIDKQENEGDNDNNEGATQPPRTTRSGRAIKLTQRLQESSLLPKLHSFISFAHHISNVIARLDDNSLNEMFQIVAYSASMADTDTMYLQQAMKQDDRDEFLKAMIKEIEDHTVRGHWRITTRQEMRERNYMHKPIAAIWSFKRKRNPFGEITKYKGRLCCHGGQTIKGIHYDETFSAVVA